MKNKVLVLTDLQYRVYEAFDKCDTDISIEILYQRVYGEDVHNLSTREKQMKLGPTFSVINRKLKGARIEPGKVKKTYRLNTKGE